jgi:YihY family inner membrane protein
MNAIDKFINRINKLQQKHPVVAFTVAVVKKYNDDNAGTHAALLTYYSFLALFPLLLLLTTVLDTVVGVHSHIRTTIIDGVTSYFPLLGSDLTSHVHEIHKNGIALMAAILLIFYGTRGVANNFTKSVQDIWLIPDKNRDGFPKNLFRSISLILVGGIGLILTSVTASLATAGTHGLIYRAIDILVNALMLFAIFSTLLNLSLPKHVTVGETKLGAAVATVGLIILQIVGGYVLSHELKHLSALYSYFAITLGLMFWLYLQAQVLYYSIEISIVSSQSLWPRSLNSNYTTEADHRMSQLK